MVCTGPRCSRRSVLRMDGDSSPAWEWAEQGQPQGQREGGRDPTGRRTTPTCPICILMGEGLCVLVPGDHSIMGWGVMAPDLEAGKEPQRSSKGWQSERKWREASVLGAGSGRDSVWSCGLRCCPRPPPGVLHRPPRLLGIGPRGSYPLGHWVVELSTSRGGKQQDTCQLRLAGNESLRTRDSQSFRLSLACPALLSTQSRAARCGCQPRMDVEPPAARLSASPPLRPRENWTINFSVTLMEYYFLLL